MTGGEKKTEKIKKRVAEKKKDKEWGKCKPVERCASIFPDFRFGFLPIGFGLRVRHGRRRINPTNKLCMTQHFTITTGYAMPSPRV